MEIYCSFNNILYKDQKNGMAAFAVKPFDTNIPVNEEYQTLICKGVLFSAFPKNMPLLLEGEYINSKEPYFSAKNIKPAGKNDATTLSFLKDSNFKGIGEAYSKKIIDLTNGDIFNYCKNRKAYDELIALGLKEEYVIAFINKIHEYSKMQELIYLITYYGGEYSKAKKVYEKYGKDSIDEINKNPYILQDCGVDYFIMEALAKKAGINVLNETRISSLIKEAINNLESNGNTRMTFKMLFKTCKYLEDRSNQGYETPFISILAHVIRKIEDYHIKETKKGYVLYSKKMYNIESKSARHVARLLDTKIDFPVDKASVEKIEKENNIKYGKEQKDAFNLLKTSGIKILTGGPGTGKSTVIDGLIKYYHQMFPEKSVALCSPTGAASKKLREITGNENAMTIHKLLDVRPGFGNSYEYKDEYNQLEYDLIIADEFSMADAELFMMLVSGMKDSSLLLIVGDQNQLSSVGSGKVLYDLLNSNLIDSVMLNEIYRQAGESSIITNSIKIKNGESDLKSDNSFEIYTVDSEKSMLDLALRMVKGLKKNNIKNFKLYSPVKRKEYLTSTYTLNNEIRDMYNDTFDKRFLIYNDVKFYIDDPVIMTKNNYKKGFLNGDQGKIVDIVTDNRGNSNMFIKLDDYEEEIVLKGADLGQVELSYSLTIHKSQGSECDIAIILIPEKPKGMLERSLVYVASTRARKKSVFIVENNALSNAIITDRRYLRNTGLLDEIKEAMELKGN